MQNKLVSIIIPVWNLEAYLNKCFESLLIQTYSNIEIIIVDDGSTDNSINIIEGFRNKDSRIVLLKSDHQGTASARKKGILYAHGDFITFVDGDDFCENDAIETMVSAFIDSDTDIVVAQHRRIFPHKGDYVEYKDDYPFENINSEGFLDIINERRDFTLWAKMFKKEMFDNIIFHEGVPIGQDGLVLKQAILKASSIKSVNKVVYNYLYRMGSAMRKSKLLKNQLHFLKGSFNNLCFYHGDSYVKERDKLIMYLLELGAYYLKMDKFERSDYTYLWDRHLSEKGTKLDFQKNHPQWKNLEFINKFPRIYSLTHMVPEYYNLLMKKVKR